MKIHSEHIGKAVATLGVAAVSIVLVICGHPNEGSGVIVIGSFCIWCLS